MIAIQLTERFKAIINRVDATDSDVHDFIRLLAASPLNEQVEFWLLTKQRPDLSNQFAEHVMANMSHELASLLAAGIDATELRLSGKVLPPAKFLVQRIDHDDPEYSEPAVALVADVPLALKKISEREDNAEVRVSSVNAKGTVHVTVVDRDCSYQLKPMETWS